jgi:hypothetical protein
LAQPVETKREVWLRGVDLNHRPLLRRLRGVSHRYLSEMSHLIL